MRKPMTCDTGFMRFPQRGILNKEEASLFEFLLGGTPLTVPFKAFKTAGDGDNGGRESCWGGC